MAAYPQTMPQTAYRRAIPPPTGMTSQFPTYQPSVVAPAAGMNMPPTSVPMPNRAVARPPQTFYSNAAAQPGSIPAPPMKGTLRPGERIRVGGDTVIIEKYLSEGGYAHVYLTHSETPLGPNKLTTHCLKRLAFRDEQAPDMMKDVEKEIEVMKALRGNPWIVEYLGSEVRRTAGTAGHGSGWEVFILMEFCSGGGIIDLLNKRLRDRLKEAEILSIFADVCEAVAYMHSLPKPLLHRDLKIENILCHPTSPNNPPGSSSISSFRYKLCDFGSTTYPSTHAPRNKREADEQAYDLNRHTTLQYRSPEMVEPLLGLPVGLPSDVWALGVLLYKLCYYTTPFEEHGPLAIVNAKYVFPSFPVYSPKLQHVIASMLIDQPARRPSVFDILNQVHRMRGTQPSRNYQQVPTIVEPRQTTASFSSARASSSLSSGNLLDFTDSKPISASPSSNSFLAATIQPQRRGRPTRGPVATPSTTQTSASNLAASPQSYGSRVPPQSASSPTPSNASRPQSISPQPQLVSDIKQFAADFSDAFEPEGSLQTGGPRSQGEHSDSFGFENSFAPSPNLNAPAQKLSPLITSKSLQPGVGNGMTSSSGFETSFSPASPADNAALSSSKTANVSATKIENLPGAETASSNPGAQASFEDRYPSLERLHSNDSAHSPSGTSPLLSPLNSASGNGVNANVRPQRGGSLQRSMPSYHQASLTGGGLGEGHVPFNDINGGVPLPRSNQVTGTAFKMSDGTPEPSHTYREEATFERITSPSASPGDSSLPDYIDLPSPTAEPARVIPVPEHARQPTPSDQAAEDRSAIPYLAPMRDLLTGDDGTSLPFLSMQPNKQPFRPTTGTRAPPPPAAKPPSLSVNLGSAHSRPPLSKTHSSMYDVAGSPVEANKRDLSKTSVPQSSSVTESVHLGRKDQQFVTSPKSEDKQPLLSGSQASLPREDSVQGNLRSQTLGYRSVDSAKPAPKPSTYPIPGEKPLPTASETIPSGRPEPSRHESSINALVSGAEAIKSSDSGSSIHGRERPAVGKKPQVAIKPDQLKAPGRGSSPSSNASSDLTTNRSTSGPRGFAGRASDTTSTEAESSADSHARIPTQTETSTASIDDQPNTTRRNVNALIAQWNQAGPPAQGTPASALRAKPAIGTGRRL